MPEYLVERYEPGTSAEALRATARRLAEAAAQLQEGGAAIEFLGLTFLPGDEAVFERFLSDSERSVVAAHERAGIPFDRITEAIPL